jgi:glycosyltransferase involved in cell wall biosynthesis
LQTSLAEGQPLVGGVVIPCYNHLQDLPLVLKEVRTVVPELPILVVDDGSNPPVGPISGVTLLRHRVNKGKGLALLSGIERLQNCDYLVFLDADGQHPAEEIPRLIRRLTWDRQSALVLAARDFWRDRSIPVRHAVANIVLSLEFALLYGRFVPDLTCGLRVARVSSLLESRILYRGFNVDIDMISAAVQAGSKIGWVHVRGVRYGGVSGLRRGLKMTASLAIWMVIQRFRRIRSAPGAHESAIVVSA